MKAVILAAGRGTRLLPLTESVPKPLIEVNGVPILERMLKQLKSVGITDVVVVVHHLKGQIMNYCSGSPFGMNVTCVEQEEMKGTADAVLCAESHVVGRFICIAVDSFFETSLLDELINTEGGIITCKEVEDASRYGVLEVSGEEVVKIVEKSSNPPSNLANFSVYVFPHEIFDACKELIPSARGEFEITDAINLLIERGVEFKYLKTEILDIGTPEQLKEAEEIDKAN